MTDVVVLAVMITLAIGALSGLRLVGFKQACEPVMIANMRMGDCR